MWWLRHHSLGNLTLHHDGQRCRTRHSLEQVSKDDGCRAVRKVGNHFISGGQAELFWLQVARITLHNAQPGFLTVDPAKIAGEIRVKFHGDDSRGPGHECASQYPKTGTDLKNAVLVGNH